MAAKSSIVHKIHGEQPSFEELNFSCDLELEASNRISAHDTPAHDNAPPYTVWFEMVKRFRWQATAKIALAKLWGSSSPTI